MAFEAGVDFVTHISLDRPPDAAESARTAAQGQVCTPTLTMMEGTATVRGVAPAHGNAVRSVTRSTPTPTPSRGGALQVGTARASTANSYPWSRPASPRPSAAHGHRPARPAFPSRRPGPGRRGLRAGLLLVDGSAWPTSGPPAPCATSDARASSRSRSPDDRDPIRSPVVRPKAGRCRGRRGARRHDAPPAPGGRRTPGRCVRPGAAVCSRCAGPRGRRRHEP